MSEVWDDSFKKNSKMWGDGVSVATVRAYEVFGGDLSSVLIPGVGYGRNARYFVERGIDVVGIEISKTAIDIARGDGLDFDIHHGPVSDMPFDNRLFDGVYSYCLLHLLDGDLRCKFISDCYSQLSVGGKMIFVTISPGSIDVSKHELVSDNCYSVAKGVNLYFYDMFEIKRDFEKFGLRDVIEIKESQKNGVLWLSMIVCEKE